MSVRGTADGCHLTWRRLFYHRRLARHRCRLRPRVCGNGWNTAFTYSARRDKADRLAGETGALALLADQQDTAAVENAVAEGKARFGTIDAVVCNAGIAEQKLFQNITDADWMRMLDVNLMGTVRTIRAVLPEMLHNHKGSIVTVSSMWGECGASCESHYSASKAAIIGLIKSLAQELGPSNIRVNCIAPGVIDTNMNAMHSADTMQELADQTPLERIGARTRSRTAFCICARISRLSLPDRCSV